MDKRQRRFAKDFKVEAVPVVRRAAGHSGTSPMISALVYQRRGAGSTSAASAIWRRRLPSGRKIWPKSCNGSDARTRSCTLNAIS